MITFANSYLKVPFVPVKTENCKPCLEMEKRKTSILPVKNRKLYALPRKNLDFQSLYVKIAMTLPKSSFPAWKYQKVSSPKIRRTI